MPCMWRFVGLQVNWETQSFFDKNILLLQKCWNKSLAVGAFILFFSFYSKGSVNFPHIVLPLCPCPNLNKMNSWEMGLEGQKYKFYSTEIFCCLHQMRYLLVLFGKDRLSDWEIVGTGVKERKILNFMYFHTLLKV